MIFRSIKKPTPAKEQPVGCLGKEGLTLFLLLDFLLVLALSLPAFGIEFEVVDHAAILPIEFDNVFGKFDHLLTACGFLLVGDSVFPRGDAVMHIRDRVAEPTVRHVAHIIFWFVLGW